MKHGLAGYANKRCRCEVCTRAARDWQRIARARRRAARVMIDGRLVAVNAKEHGTESTRSNHGCQCWPCVRAHNEYQRSSRPRRSR